MNTNYRLCNFLLFIILAIGLGFCAMSCERRNRLNVIYDKLDSLTIEIDKTRNAFDNAKTLDQQVQAWDKSGDIIIEKMKLINEADSLLYE